MSARFGKLACGHERWLPYDYAGGPLPCSECDGRPLREVANTTPDFDAMTRAERKAYIRRLRDLARESSTGSQA